MNRNKFSLMSVFGKSQPMLIRKARSAISTASPNAQQRLLNNSFRLLAFTEDAHFARAKHNFYDAPVKTNSTQVNFWTRKECDCKYQSYLPGMPLLPEIVIA